MRGEKYSEKGARTLAVRWALDLYKVNNINDIKQKRRNGARGGTALGY